MVSRRISAVTLNRSQPIRVIELVHKILRIGAVARIHLQALATCKIATRNIQAQRRPG